MSIKTEEQEHYVPRGPVDVELNFIEYPADGSVPYLYSQQPSTGEPALNFSQPALRVHLSDIRNRETNYNLDKDGFQALQHVLPNIPYETFLSDSEIQRIYYHEVEKLLLGKVEGAHSVVIFDHVIRREQGIGLNKPVFTAHVDQGASEVERWLRRSVPGEEKVEQLLRGRYRIINVWKPINGTILSCPLAVASGCSVDPKDLVCIEFRLPDRTGDLVWLRYNPKQQWMYWSGMENDECLLFKCYDNSSDAVAPRVPHSAFVDPRTPAGAKGRESIEVRAFVFG